MIRTQIYLNENQKRALDKLSSRYGESIAELIRKAVDEFLFKEASSFDDVLEESFGIWKGRKDIGKAEDFVRRLRLEWELR